ncbi:hypothetical protein [Rheinheimera sp.]|uniref:hypothetical protein n=1 Tax=Rheinheimera sp. TaxID=1869214 RepID=UPI003AF68937
MNTVLHASLQGLQKIMVSLPKTPLLVAINLASLNESDSQQLEFSYQQPNLANI